MPGFKESGIPERIALLVVAGLPAAIVFFVTPATFGIYRYAMAIAAFLVTGDAVARFVISKRITPPPESVQGSVERAKWWIERSGAFLTTPRDSTVIDQTQEPVSENSQMQWLFSKYDRVVGAEFVIDRRSIVRHKRAPEYIAIGHCVGSKKMFVFANENTGEIVQCGDTDIPVSFDSTFDIWRLIDESCDYVSPKAYRRRQS